MNHYSQPYYGFNQNLQHGAFDTLGPTPNMPQPAMLDNRDNRFYQQEQISPSQQIAMRNNNQGLLYDMDSGSVRTEKRHDPYGAAILLRLDTIQSELAATVKTTDIVDMARKSDLKTLQDRLDAQAVEIQELRTHLLQQQGKVNKMCEVIDSNAAGIVNLGQQSADLKERFNADKQSSHYDRAAQPDSRHTESGPSPKHQNIIIEGAPEEDPYEYVIKLADEMGFTLYRRDIVYVTRLRRRDSRDDRPPPLLVGFSHVFIRNNFLKNKRQLKSSPRYGHIWINADETIEIRRRKSEFRKIAYKARENGESAYFNHEYIKIGNQTYYEQDLRSIPEKYKPGRDDKRDDAPFQFRPTTNIRKDDPPRMNVTTQPPRSGEGVNVENRDDMTQTTGAAVNLDQPADPPPVVLYPPSDPTVKIRLTDHGLLFSGHSAFISNHHVRHFVYENIDHKTVEHGYCFKKAVCYKRMDLADRVRNANTALDAKDVIQHLPINPEWERIKAPTLRDLFIARLSQHPDLMEAFLKTSPHRLIEASWDSLWGGGAPFESPLYNEGKFTGFNQFGDMATTYRDEKLKLRQTNP